MEDFGEQTFFLDVMYAKGPFTQNAQKRAPFHSSSRVTAARASEGETAQFFHIKTGSAVAAKRPRTVL